MRPDLANSQAWDPALLFVDAAQARRLVGERCAERGIGQNATIMYTWDVGKADFAVASKPAGYLLR